MEFRELSSDEIAELTTARPGQYRDVLTQFVDSGFDGADVSGAFPGKKLSTAASALKRTAEKHSIPVTVVHRSANDNRAESLALIRS